MKRISDIVKEYPNDEELGSVIRMLYMEPEMVEQQCEICGEMFKGNIDFPICQSCYI
jgi:hypothetical protein